MIKYQFFHWGPLLCRFDVSRASIDTLLKHATKKEPCVPDLAGIIKEGEELTVTYTFYKI